MQEWSMSSEPYTLVKWKGGQFFPSDIWTTLRPLAYFGEATAPGQITSLRMDSASIQLPGKIISEHNGIRSF